MSTNTLPEPIIFTFPESVFGRRLERYLNLRRIPFTTILVPPRLPRPILSSGLSISHRRIPIVALGRDIYIDTRLIVAKLEQLYPDSPDHPALGAKDSFGRGLEQLIESWVIDAGPFWRTSGTIPPEAPLMRDPEWVEDRRQGSGGMFTLEAMAKDRAWCLSQLRIYFGILENMLGDGRKWILGDGERPGLGDIHGCWVFDWAINMAEDMLIDGEERDRAVRDAKTCLSNGEFPRVHAWVQTFRRVCDEAVEKNRIMRLKGGQAEKDIVERIRTSEFVEPKELQFEIDDVLQLSKGQIVSIAPADFGFTHADQGQLVGLMRNEVVIQRGEEHQGLRLHFPRLNFKMESRE